LTSDAQAGPVGVAIARALVRHGVTHVFGIPGIHTMELYRGLAETEIRHVTSRHEQSAVFMADGYARSTGQPGVACLITGPGIANGATAIAEAYSDSVPILVLTTQIERELAGQGKRRSHELFDQQSLLRGLTPNVARANSGQDAVAAIDAAFEAFSASRPVPAIVEIPIDVLAGCEVVAIREPSPTEPTLPPSLHLERARGWLERAERPLIIVGGGAQGAAAEVVKLAEVLGAAVVSSSSGKGVVPDRHPLFLTAGLDLAAVRTAVREADVLLVIGCEIGHMDTYVADATPWPTPRRTIQIDIDPTQIGRNAHANLGLVGDAAATSAWLVERLHRTSPRRTADAATKAAVDHDARSVAGGLAPWIDALDAGLPPDAILAADITRPVTYAAIYISIDAIRRGRGFGRSA